MPWLQCVGISDPRLIQLFRQGRKSHYTYWKPPDLCPGHPLCSQGLYTYKCDFRPRRIAFANLAEYGGAPRTRLPSAGYLPVPPLANPLAASWRPKEKAPCIARCRGRDGFRAPSASPPHRPEFLTGRQQDQGVAGEDD